MNKVREKLDAQASWQRSRASLSWAEKLKQSLIMRKTQLLMQKKS